MAKDKSITLNVNNKDFKLDEKMLRFEKYEQI
jgi:hypothetical protein